MFVASTVNAPLLSNPELTFNWAVPVFLGATKIVWMLGLNSILPALLVYTPSASNWPGVTKPNRLAIISVPLSSIRALLKATWYSFWIIEEAVWYSEKWFVILPGAVSQEIWPRLLSTAVAKSSMEVFSIFSTSPPDLTVFQIAAWTCSGSQFNFLDISLIVFSINLSCGFVGLPVVVKLKALNIQRSVVIPWVREGSITFIKLV